MEFRRFFAPSMKQAIELVRENLGVNAIIVSNRQISGGFEIEAATSEQTSTKSCALPTALSLNQQQYDQTKTSLPPLRDQNTTHTYQPTPSHHNRVAHQENPARLDRLEQELAVMRSLLDTRLKQAPAPKHQETLSIEDTMKQRLHQLGFQVDVANCLVRGLHLNHNSDIAWQQCLQKLSTSLSTHEDEINQPNTVLSLIGQAGMGKTTSLAKLAAHYVLQHGPDNIGLVSTDYQRTAGREQLRTYGKILGINVFTANNEEQLNYTLLNLSQKKLILIDNMGMSPRDPELLNKLSMFKTHTHIKNCLVLSSTNQADITDEAIRAFSLINLHSCIITKVDETCSLGQTLNACIRHKLPISYVTTGQHMPNDIQAAKIDWLIRKILETSTDFSKPDRHLHSTEDKLGKAL